MGLLTSLLEQHAVYRVWQAPFASAKLAPLLARGELRRAKRVLDVGCGPGTNTPLFSHADYLGIDINEDYVAHARGKYKRPFLVADLTQYTGGDPEPFDFILVNSFLHHIDTAHVHRILEQLVSWLSPGGKIHILELVLPSDASIARNLARWDRGKYARPLEEWRRLFEQHMEIAVFEPYPLKALGATLWNMVYCQGSARP